MSAARSLESLEHDARVAVSSLELRAAAAQTPEEQSQLSQDAAKFAAIVQRLPSVRAQGLTQAVARATPGALDLERTGPSWADILSEASAAIDQIPSFK